MSAQEFRNTLKRLGLKQADLAILLRVNSRTVNTWATQDDAVPGPAVAYLRVLQMLTPKALSAELALINQGTARMLDNGLYNINFAGQSDIGTGALIFKDGLIIGADIGGVQYDGRYSFDDKIGQTIAEISLKIPPQTELVTGAIAGEYGNTLTLQAAFDKPSPLSVFRVDVYGRPVDVELCFMRKLPG